MRSRRKWTSGPGSSPRFGSAVSAAANITVLAASRSQIFFRPWVINRNGSGRPHNRTRRMPCLECDLHGFKAIPLLARMSRTVTTARLLNKRQLSASRAASFRSSACMRA
jgi:hypothetical protein